MSSLKVAVAGATGNVGRPIVKQLLAAGFRVTVLTRVGSTSAATKFDDDLNSNVIAAPYMSV